MPTTYDPTGANNMVQIKDRITKTLSDATRDMTPLETFGNIGRAAAQAATGNVTYGDAMNAMNAKRQEAAKQMMQVLQQQEQIDLQKQAGARADEQLGLQKDQFGLSQKQFGLQQQQFEAGEARAAGQEERETRRLGMEESRLGLEEDRLNLSREELNHRKLQDAAAQGNEEAKAVVDALQSLVPEEQRATYAAELADLPYPVDRSNVVQAIGRVRRDLEERGGIPEEGADFKDTTSLRKNFESLAGEFIGVRDSYGTMLGLADQLGPSYEYEDPANTGPGDLSFIFAYMKMLDPTSAVREGEQATAQNARGVEGGIRNIYNEIINGAKLTPAQRRGFLNQATALYKQRQGNYDNLAEGYTLIAKNNKMNPSDVVLDFAGPYRYRAMDDEELTSALEGAKSRQEVDAIVEEFSRRNPGGGSAQRPFEQGSLKLTKQEERIVNYHRNSVETGMVGTGPQGEPVTVYSIGIRVPEGPNKGKFVSVPGWVNGKILSEREAYSHWKAEIQAGKWPLYSSGQELNRRSQEIHQIMDAEAGQARRAREQ